MLTDSETLLLRDIARAAYRAASGGREPNEAELDCYESAIDGLVRSILWDEVFKRLAAGGIRPR